MRYAVICLAAVAALAPLLAPADADPPPDYGRPT